MANSEYVVAMPELPEITDSAVVVFEDVVLSVDLRAVGFSNSALRCVRLCVWQRRNYLVVWRYGRRRWISIDVA